MTQGTLGAAYRRLATPTQQFDPELIADWEWATVTGVSPLRVRRDTDTSVSSATPATLVGEYSLTVGDRVMTIIVKGSLIVIGRYSGITPPPEAPAPAMAKMTKTDSGPTFTANTWTQVTGFGTIDYSDGVTAGGATGRLTIVTAGYYDVSFNQRWENYGSAYSRSGAIVLGTSAPATDASNVIGVSTYSHAGWLIAPFTVNNYYLDVGDIVTFWIMSSAGSTFNAVNTAIPGWTNVVIREAR